MHQVTQQQVCHVDEATAYYVHNYPYAFGKFCTIRYWVETRQAYGQRLMVQIQDPANGQWFKAKTDGYFDMCIITTVVNPGHPNHGWVVPIQIKLNQFDLATLNQFGVYYTFTPFQQKAIMEALKAFSIYLAPKWNNAIELNHGLLNRAEYPRKATVKQLTDENGFPIESLLDAEKRTRKEKREQWPSTLAKREEAAQPSADGITIKGGRKFLFGEDVTDMSEAQIATMRDLMG